MTKTVVTVLGKGVRRIAQLRGGSGSALPGLFVEKIDPHFIRDTLAALPHGVAIVSGTNGKTTTTKMVVELLESQGLKVFTNRTGSNFTRGVAAALLGEVDTRGRLDADIAVLELDEAHAVHFVKTVKPKYALLLNVMRDQLDRFGEIDTTAKMLQTIAAATTDHVVFNRDDPRLAAQSFRDAITADISTYGTSDAIKHAFPSDDVMRAEKIAPANDAFLQNDTELQNFSDQTVSMLFSGQHHSAKLKIGGIYNVLNAVGAVALTRAITGKSLDIDRMLTALTSVTPAFGRGETLLIAGQTCELILVKNPSGFRLALQSFLPAGYTTMIAVNDNYADGRDMSWLWDVDFESLSNDGVAVVSGVRATDMALRLKYDEVMVGTVEEDLHQAVEHLLAHTDSPKRIYCTYTAMLEIRRILAKKTTVEKIR